MNKNKGFTLIELLVVIAIIGILASIVLASLNTARQRAADSKIKGQLTSLRAAAEIYYGDELNYSTTATADACASMSGTSASAVASGFPNLMAADNWVGDVPTCTATPTEWAAYKVLSTGAAFCVDSTGASKELPTPPTGSITVCP